MIAKKEWKEMTREKFQELLESEHGRAELMGYGLAKIWASGVRAVVWTVCAFLLLCFWSWGITCAEKTCRFFNTPSCSSEESQLPQPILTREQSEKP